jgi:hypothetical protein
VRIAGQFIAVGVSIGDIDAWVVILAADLKPLSWVNWRECTRMPVSQPDTYSSPGTLLARLLLHPFRTPFHSPNHSSLCSQYVYQCACVGCRLSYAFIVSSSHPSDFTTSHIAHHGLSWIWPPFRQLIRAPSHSFPPLSTEGASVRPYSLQSTPISLLVLLNHSMVCSHVKSVCNAISTPPIH